MGIDMRALIDREIVAPREDARRDDIVNVLDTTSLLPNEDHRVGSNGKVGPCLSGDEVDFQGVVSCRCI